MQMLLNTELSPFLKTGCALHRPDRIVSVKSIVRFRMTIGSLVKASKYFSKQLIGEQPTECT